MGKASSDCVETTPPLATLTYTVALNALWCRLGLHSMATRSPPSSCTNSITGCFARLPSAAAAATALKDASKLFSAAPKGATADGGSATEMVVSSPMSTEGANVRGDADAVVTRVAQGEQRW